MSDETKPGLPTAHHCPLCGEPATGPVALGKPMPCCGGDSYAAVAAMTAPANASPGLPTVPMVRRKGESREMFALRQRAISAEHDRVQERSRADRLQAMYDMMVNYVVDLGLDGPGVIRTPSGQALEEALRRMKADMKEDGNDEHGH